MKLLAASLLCLLSTSILANNLPQSMEELEKRYLTAYQNKNADGIYNLIDWTGISGYKKKMVKVYTRNSLGKKIRNTEFEAVDEKFFSDFSVGDKHFKSNLAVNNLFRIEFDNPQREESLVYLVGKSPKGYQFSLSIRNKIKSKN
ncbi:MAG: hypothetical protein ACI9LM_005572 [Alteromonadaceae bacterium]|jgi:hypothetical protein